MRLPVICLAAGSSGKANDRQTEKTPSWQHRQQRHGRRPWQRSPAMPFWTHPTNSCAQKDC